MRKKKNKKVDSVKVAICVVLAGILTVSSVIGVNWMKTPSPTIGVAEETEAQVGVVSEETFFNYDELSLTLSNMTGKTITSGILRNFTVDQLNTLRECTLDGFITDKECHDSIGYTLNALVDAYGTGKSIKMGNNGSDRFTVGFTGDINFTYSGYVMTHARNMPNSALDCIDETFQNEMRNADIMLINNEFPYSDRGAPVDKKYTFRSEPENVNFLIEMGVDIVSLANNHTFDYGPDAFDDTLKTLDDAGIARVGAGMNKEEASAPVTFIVNGYKVAFLACSGVENPPYPTKVATETEKGIMGSYDSGEAMVAAIKKAKEDCDYIFVYPHWGMENTTSLTNAQQVNARKYIDAGATAVVGDHPHILQGMEYYNDALIVYSMGNFWFNTRNQPTMLLKFEICDDGTITPIIVPGTQANSETHYMEDANAQRNLYDNIMSWSPNSGVRIDDNGCVSNPSA